MNFFVVSSYDKSYFYMAITIAFIVVFPFLLNDIYYADDLSRAMTGVLGWSDLGRPVSDFVMLFINFSFSKIADISPLPQLFSALSLAYSCYISVRKFFGSMSFYKVFVFSGLICNPFFLQNISYKYDSFPMSLSVLFTCAAFCFSFNKQVYNLIASSVCLILSLCLYQPTSNIFIGLIAVSVIVNAFKYNNSKQLIVDFLFQSFSFVLSYFFYMVFVIPVFSKSPRGDIVDISADGYNNIIINIDLVLKIVSKLATYEYVFVFLPFFISSLVLTLILIVRLIKHESLTLSSVMASIILLISPVLSVLAIIGPMFLLKNFYCVPRVLTGFASFLCFLFVCFYILLEVASYKIKKVTMARLYLLIPVLFFISLTFAYVSSAREQFRYESNLISSVYNSIISDDVIENSEKILVAGEPEYSKVFKVNASLFPVIYNMAYKMNYWTGAMALQNMNLNNVYYSFKSNEATEEIIKICSLGIDPRVNNNSYSIYHYNNNSYVWFKDNRKSMC